MKDEEKFDCCRDLNIYLRSRQKKSAVSWCICGPIRICLVPSLRREEVPVFHLNVKYRSRDGGGSCEAAMEYIAREGRYKGRGDKVRWVQSLHMPAWAGGATARVYWHAAEGPHSRANARTAMLVEFAIPKELPPEDQDALVLEMMEQLSQMGVEEPGHLARLPVTGGVHEGYGRNPHAHVLLSLSLNDGIARDELTWFRRHSPKAPEKGGARRSSYVTQRRWLYRVREEWASLANAALVRRGLKPTLDHRSHASRGLTTLPQIHLGPRIAGMRDRGLDTVRGRRSQEIEEANRTALEVEANLFRRRRALHAAEMDLEAAVRSKEYWLAMQRDEWTEALSTHPLTGSAVALRMHATALLIESDAAARAASGARIDPHGDVGAFAKALGPGWETVATSHGLCGIRPGHDSVVLLRSGLAATDGEDDESLRAVLNAAPVLGLKQPLVAVRDGLRAAAQTLLDLMGLPWRLISTDGPGPKRVRTPRI